MHITNRRKLGLALMTAAMLAGVILQLSFGGVVKERTVRENRSLPLADFIVSLEVELEFNWWYAIPLATLLTAGLGFLIWPQRKPPRLV